MFSRCLSATMRQGRDKRMSSVKSAGEWICYAQALGAERSGAMSCQIMANSSACGVTCSTTCRRQQCSIFVRDDVVSFSEEDTEHVLGWTLSSDGPDRGERLPYNDGFCR